MHLQLVAKRFPGADQDTLAEIDLSLSTGSFLALLGPSGVGKTTLLRILAGLDTEYRGECTRVSGGVGYLFQEPRLMPWLSAEENVALVVNGDRHRAREALAAVQLVDAIRFYPHQLSGGMQRRVALARAIVSEPKVLLLDEPFVSLDQPGAQQLQALLLEYWQRERPCILLVSHNLLEAISLADELLFLGGSPASVIHRQPLGLERPRGVTDAAVIAERDKLLASYPQLLSGGLSGVD